MARVDVYQLVTDRIIEQLDQGVVPWRMPWLVRGNAPVNWATQRLYRGINRFLLPPGGEYATFLQIQKAGGRVKKGEKGYIVVLWKPYEVEEEKDGETIKQTRLFLKYYTVFEINTQCVGLESRRPKLLEFDHDPIEEAERIVAGYKSAPKIRYAPGQAFYRPSMDLIQMPPLKDFPKAEEFYSTLFHEMVHSTGHASRLDREGVTNSDGFGNEKYSFEELIAELGAAYLCAEAGIDNSTIENSSAYIAGWLRKFRNDKTMIIRAASQAQKAADFILGVGAEDEAEEETEKAVG
jgi:antirestriction protein ArdC